MKRIALPLLLASTMLAQVASAQTSSSTPVIGYYKFDVPTGTSAWTCGFVTKKDFQGAMTGVTSGANTVIDQTGAGWVVNAFSSHYVEILSGVNTGLILDIVSNTASSVTVEGNIALPVGTTYCIRKHATLGTIFVGGAGLTPFADTVTIFGSDGSEKIFAHDGGQWVDGGDLSTPKDSEVIYPGQGFLITVGSDTNITFGGGEVSYVKTGPTRIPLYAGVFNLVGIIDPVVATSPADPLFASPDSKTATGALGLVASLTPYADAFTQLSGDGLLTDAAIYASDGSIIVDGGDLTTDRSAVLLGNGTAFAITPGADISYQQPQLTP